MTIINKMRLSVLSSRQSSEESTQWLPISDLMSGLMVLFLFIAISLILQVRQIAEEYQDTQEQIYEALLYEFADDLPKWGAKIDKDTLTISFLSPDILFKTGQSDLQDNYKEILSDFFPRYIKVIDRYKDSINEIRIEGHTSSEWAAGVDVDTAYFENMRLSQDRTRTVLQFAYAIPEVSQYRPWIKTHLAAVGLSSAKTIKNESGLENAGASKRVTFRILTNADEQIQKISKSSYEEN